MTEIHVYTDPHQGLNLVANTTPKSRERLKDSMKNTLGKLLTDHSYGEGELYTVCLGDFFHNFHNSEEVLLDAVAAARFTDVILGGNHDVVNDNERKSTLHVIAEMFPGKVVLPKFDEVVVTSRCAGEANFVLIPHHSSKELFSKALTKSTEYIEEGKKNYLCLHCNYDSGYATNDTELNLTRKEAETLLKSFDYILIGHDHHHKTDFDGRVIVLGNTYPTNFGDICDKKDLWIDKNGVPTSSRLLWQEDKYISVDHSNLDLIDPQQHEWVRITGTAEPSQISDISRAVKKLWDATDCTLVAIRSEVQIVSDVKAKAGASVMAGKNLKKIVEAALEGQPEMLSLWGEITDETA